MALVIGIHSASVGSVRALAERLAELTRNDSDPRQQALLATVLDDLLNR